MPQHLSFPAFTRPGSLLLLGFCSLLQWPAYALTPDEISAGQNQSERILREEQARQREQLRRDQENARGATHLDAPLVEPKQRPQGPCRDVARVVVKGNSLLSGDVLGAITSAYEKRCLGVNDIEQLLAALTNAYISAGYVSVRVYLPQQDLGSGTLEVLVVEGRVEKILIEDGGKGSVSVANVAPGVVGKPLNLRDFEQALEQINRLASNDATFEIQPGSEPGDSVVVIGNKPGRPYRANISHDNQGSKTTGQTQTGVNLLWDNPLGFNDFVSYTYRQATPYDPPNASSWSNSLNYIVPFGYSTLTASGSNSAYTSSFVAPSGNTLHSRGTSEQYALRLDHMVYRGQSTRWNLATSLTNKDSKSYLENVFLAVSSRRLSVLDLDSSLTFAFAGGSLTLDAGYARGLHMLGALKDADFLPGTAPRAQFEKWKYGFNYQLPFKAAAQDWSFSSTLVGQRAQDVLYGSEQIMIGGIYSVRGFVRNVLAGDNGFYWRNELGFRRPVLLADGFSGSIRPYLALDHGRVDSRVAGVPSGSLTGMAIGVSLSLNKVTFDLFNGRPLDKPDFMPREGTSTFFRVNIQL